MKVFFITALYGLKISENLERGDRIDDNTFITNNFSKIKHKIGPECIPIIGTMELNNILNADTVVYSEETLPENITTRQFLVFKLSQVKMFQMCLWVMQDNSTNNELGFLIYENGNQTYVDSNFIASKFSTAETEDIRLIVNREQLRAVRKIFRLAIDTDELINPIPITTLKQDTTRMSRFFYLLQLARSLSDIALKITIYCSAFETLFSTSSSELTHQLSERLSVLIAQSPDERLLIYSNMKKAYNIRSQIIHGDVVKYKDLSKLTDTAKLCDEYSRMCFQLLLRDKHLREILDGPLQKINEHFLKLLFNCS